MFGMYEKDKRSIEKLDSPHIFGDHHLLNSLQCSSQVHSKMFVTCKTFLHVYSWSMWCD